jgi:hypothetical protein
MGLVPLSVSYAAPWSVAGVHCGIRRGTRNGCDAFWDLTFQAELAVAVAIDPGLAQSLTDARLQLHHAAQLATASGISYLPAQPDDSHTNLEWLADLRALAARVIPASQPFRVAVQPADLSISILDPEARIVASSLLNGLTMDDAADWLRLRIAERGGDRDALTLKRHYEIPKHAVDEGGTFDTRNARAFAQLDAWYSAAAQAMERVRESNHGAEVRCWPHHFDIATLISVGGGKTIGVGMEPGDQYYGEPYFYVNMTPSPKREAATVPLAGEGSWHTDEWIGAVLPGSRIADAEKASEQVNAFLDSAVAACRRLLG